MEGAKQESPGLPPTSTNNDVQTWPGTLAPWQRYRAAEWILTVSLLLILMLVGRLGTPHCREFTWTDASLAHSLTPDTVPAWALGPIAIFPAVIYTGLSFYFPVAGASPLEQSSALCLMHLSSITLAELVTEPLKLMAGRLRPDFFARLAQAGIYPPTENFAALQNLKVSYCNVTGSTVREGRKSFPSGHSSSSFSSMTPLALFLVFRFGSVRRGSLLRMVLCGCPLILAFLVAVSRTWDYRHHFSDVLAGSVIGAAAGAIAYFTFTERVTARGTGYDSEATSDVSWTAERVPKCMLRRRQLLALIV